MSLPLLCPLPVIKLHCTSYGSWDTHACGPNRNARPLLHDAGVFWAIYPPDSRTTSNDALITSEFMTFSDTTTSGSELGYLSMTNGPTTGTNDKGDLINWFGNNETSVITLPALYASGGPFGFAFRAALTPADTTLRYSVKTSAQLMAKLPPHRSSMHSRAPMWTGTRIHTI